MSKIAFMFPGQGSFEAGMGRDIALAVPEAMAIYDEGNEASGMDIKELCFNSPVEALVDTQVQQPALVTTCLAMDAALRARGSMAAILGLADEAVEALCKKISNVWPANYNCPGQLVISGETPSVDEACIEAETQGARRAIKLRVSGAFHTPLVARAAEVLRPAVERVHLAEGRAAFMSTVTARVEDAQRYRELLIEQLTAPVRFTQAAGELINQGVTTFVEVGPGNVLGGLLKRIDRSVRIFSVNDLKSLDEATEALG